MRHSPWVTGGRPWGAFLEARPGAADAYRRHVARERRWARRARGGFAVFMSSATDPFVPQERRLGVTAALLEAMADEPPDGLIVQTHSHRVTDALPALVRLAGRSDVRVHVSIESDRERLPGLPPPASPLERRFDALSRLRAAGLRTVVTVAPLLPIEDPRGFFARIARHADAVVIDHFVGGDGSADGRRTLATGLPAAIEAVDPAALDPAYRDRMADVARSVMPGRVGLSIDGFAGRF